ncbi:MBL fold metallo-hydrolase [Streptomyces brasiliensis]|uniref:MBL fold metallo-hydrolase n=1 Tax=Streptomyces brasiliensis TaxID=1954 RepID=A0A917KSD4_9ACTN|nr:MBL fold metallo-hydrolase [Streptomyces brasiliensis]
MLGGCGAWPAAGQACSGYLLEHDGFRLLLDPGYAVLPRLLERAAAEQVDAVLISHGHPDHCADLNPLLRARALREDPPPALPVHTLPGAIDAVLALDRPGMLQDAYRLREFTAGSGFEVGPFRVASWDLPHFVPNAGLRLSAGGRSLAYTGDTGPSPDLVELARDTDLFLAEATYPYQVPCEDSTFLSSALQAGQYADRAGTGRLLLTHLWPRSDPAAALDAARRGCFCPVDVARAGQVVDLDWPSPRSSL